MESGATVAIDAASSATVILHQRTLFYGSEGAIELFDDNVVTLFKPDAESEVFDLSPKEDDPAWPAIYDWVGVVEEALRSRIQITPSFDDGVATAEVMDKLKARMVRPPSA